MMARALTSRAVAGAATRGMATGAAAKVLPEVPKVGVIGMGLMGHGIIQVAAQAGFDVVGFDAFPGAADKAMERINGSLTKQTGRAVQKGSMTAEEAAASVESTVARITHSGDMDSLKGCSLVIEAMPEDIALKRKVWTDLQAATAGSEPILATNTSSLQLADMADSTGCPDRFVGLHFFNPVQLMRLVEVVRTDDTSEAAVDVACRFVEAIGKTPVMCKDTPGFVVNRLLVPYMAQAMAMLDRGEADVAGIDAAMRLGAGYPMGPFTLADYVGLDTCLSILRGWTEKYPDEPAFIVPDVLVRMVEAGHFGRKNGRGFYSWDGDKPTGVASIE